MSNTGLIQLSPCCCSVCSALLSAVPVSVKPERHSEILGWRQAQWGCGGHRVPGSPGRTWHSGRVLPSQQSHSRAEIPPACSTLEDVSLARLGAWRSADQKGQKAVHLPQTASPHHYPCVLLPAHEEFKWNSKARSLTVGKQCCTLTTPDYRKKHRLVQKQNSRNKNYERWERLGLGRNWHQAAYVWLQSNLLGLGE